MLMKRCHFCTRILLVVLKWQVGPTEEGAVLPYTTQGRLAELPLRGQGPLGSAWAVHHLENVCPHPDPTEHAGGVPSDHH